MLDYKKKYLPLDKYYPKEKLENGWLHWAKSFILDNQEVLDKMGKLGVGLEIIELAKRKGNLTKQEMNYVSFSVFNTKEIFHMFLLYLPEAVSKLLKTMIWERTLSLKEASTITGYSITHARKNYWQAPLFLKGYDMFSLVEQKIYDSTDKSKIFLPNELLEIVRQYMPKPKFFLLEGLDDIEPSDYRFEAEESIMVDIPKIISYRQQGLIKASSTGWTASDASLAKIQKLCNIKEFLPSEFESSGKIRTSLLVSFTSTIAHEEIGMDMTKLIKELFNKTYFETLTLYYILTFLKGLNKLYPKYETDDETEKHIVETIKLLPVDKWVSYENFSKYLTYRDLQTRPIKPNITSRKIYVTLSNENEDSEKIYIDENLYKDYIETPFLLGSFYLFASFGLLELTYQPIQKHISKKPSLYLYPPIKYFRLTNLGKYVWGLSNSYASKTTEKKGNLIFSDSSLIITIDGELDIADVLLGNYAEKIAPKKYRATHATFLKDCKTRKDITNKIALFKKTILEEPPVNWEMFFTDIVSQSLAIKIDSDYVVLSINEKDKDLQKLVAQDQVLKEIVLKAEKFNILVKSSNMSKYRNRMKELGYLVE